MRIAFGSTGYLQDRTMNWMPQLSAALAADGTVLGSVYTEKRLSIPYSSISREVIAAVLSAEDKRFFSHNGVDWIAILRAAWRNVRARRIVQGGSTITQQLVRNIVLRDNKRSISRKIRESYMALLIERQLGKRQILEAYLNAVYFGHGLYGIRMAALHYLAREPWEIDSEDAALLAGMLKGPGRYCRCCNPAIGRARTQWVLGRMASNGFPIRRRLLGTSTRRIVRRRTLDTVFPATVPYFLGYVKQWLLGSYKSHFPGRSLIVRTSLDAGLQGVLEKICRDIHIEGFGGRIACVIQDATNGFVRALAGGVDFQIHPFNVAVNGTLQPGSTIKPFVLAAALELGISLEKTYVSHPLEIRLPHSRVWHVRNYQGVYRGEITLEEALVHSDNSVFAQLILEIGVDHLAALLARLGLEAGPVTLAAGIGSLARGVSPLKIVSSYSVFSTEGFFHPPTPMISLETEWGEKIAKNDEGPVLVFSSSTAGSIRRILRDVVVRGTGALSQGDNAIHAKTGTTDDGSWYVSFDSAFRVLTWVEFAQRDQPRDYEEKGVTAKSLAERIWNLLQSGSYCSTQIYGMFRGVDRLSVRDLLWLEEEFA